MKCRKFYKLNYGECELPSKVGDTIGYHSSCANRLKALKPQHRTISTTADFEIVLYRPFVVDEFRCTHTVHFRCKYSWKVEDGSYLPVNRSQTRWSAKHVAVKALLNNLPEVVESLEELKQISDAPEAKYEAGSLLNAIKNFKFILNLTIWVNILREINLVNIGIQKQDIILARSVSLMDGLMKTLQKMRENSIEYWIEEAKEVAGKIVVETILPNKRIPRCKKQFDKMCDDESRTLQPVQLFS
ncbi:unnamed protein product [Psylliodes chrysocephalus]|uniref:Uncharacterized protein n=1 Tax=Psylliodes chrysocephalus TaxID=3402493 RepID=A0A9P0GKH8_9CUCU|nr:unnamed protein product [Psylliodes chrysocephala]